MSVGFFEDMDWILAWELQPPVPVHVASPPPTHQKHYQKGGFSRSKTQLPTEILEKAGQKKRYGCLKGAGAGVAEC